jgi:uncharacterized protein (TIGR02145 family)
MKISIPGSEMQQYSMVFVFKKGLCYILKYDHIFIMSMRINQYALGYTMIVLAAFMATGCDSVDQAEVPSVSTLRPTAITGHSAESGGIIDNSGTNPVTARGVVWNSTGNPTLEDNKGMTLDGKGAGSFNSTIGGLAPGITYYVRAYAKNQAGIAYGNQVSFATSLENNNSSGSLTDADGNEYRTVIIGQAEWMAENLRVTHYNDGRPVAAINDDDAWANATTGAWSVYPFESIDGFFSKSEVMDTYGLLYNWYAVESGRLCPAGWRVPGDGDWRDLEGFVDTKFEAGHPEWFRLGWRGHDAGQRLRADHDFGFSLKGSEFHMPVVGTDDFGFTALAGGFRNFIGPFHSQGTYGYWWSSTPAEGGGAWIRGMGFTGVIKREAPSERHGFSVRCMRDR